MVIRAINHRASNVPCVNDVRLVAPTACGVASSSQFVRVSRTGTRNQIPHKITTLSAALPAKAGHDQKTTGASSMGQRVLVSENSVAGTSEGIGARLPPSKSPFPPCLVRK
jgi:hypothetical protein